MQFHTLQSLQLWARIALPAEHPDHTTGSHYLPSHQFTTSFQKPSQTTATTLQCLELLHLPNRTDDRTSTASNISRIEHRLHRTSIALNIDRIEHLSNRTRPYEPDRTNQTFKYQNRTSNIENRTSKPNIENWTSKIEHRTSNIDQTKRTNPTVQTRPPSTQIHNQSTNPPQRNDLIWRPSESPASAITWARSQSEMPEARNLSKTPEHEASKSQMHKIAWIYWWWKTRILGRHKEGTRPTAAKGPSRTRQPFERPASEHQINSTGLIKSNTRSNQTRASI